MAAEPNAIEQAVSRALRDNLEKLQRNADELHQAVNDMVAACASSRASNALPPMVRAQASAASLSAALEVLSRFVTNSLQPSMRMPFEPEIFRVPPLVINAPPSTGAFEQPPLPLPQPIQHPIQHPAQEVSWTPPVLAPVAPMPSVSEIFPPVERPQEIPEEQPEMDEPAAAPAFSDAPEPEPADIPVPVQASAAAEQVEQAPRPEPVIAKESAPVTWREAAPDFELNFPIEANSTAESSEQVEVVEAGPVFNLDLLPPEEQELHRRAFRVAKVSMQDIRMLRPDDVRLGREKKDLCFRLRDDIEKAHKEYDRRFQSIQSHPVDYFYDWMVEILGGGDPQTLGEYPYPSAVMRR